MAQIDGNPTSGADAVGADTYVEVIAAPAGNRGPYTHLIVSCATKDAIISLDGGTTDHIQVSAGVLPMRLDGLSIRGAIQAKNAAAGENYATLVANAW